MRVVKPFEMDDRGKTLAIYPSDRFSIEYEIAFPHPWIGEQRLAVDLSPANYAKAIAPARTFGFYREVETLQSNGLVRGGSLENAIVLTDEGMLNDTALRFKDEFVRHKILDLLGDFALIGQMVAGRLVAHRAGHALHTRFVAGLLEATDCWTLETITPLPEAAREPRSALRPAVSRRV
jgi:UDP-3-O-[3-hydroxymyristoyl] N-acetylglucosamine deacetylase